MAGIYAQHWIPVSDKPLLLVPPAEGYLMVGGGIGWQRINVQGPLKGPGASG
jgi:hypothetical protein